MLTSDPAALEHIEFDACADFYRAAPEDVRSAHAIEIADLGPAVCLSCRGIEPSAVFRRAVGLGVGRTASEEELDEVLSHMNRLGLSYAVPVAPGSQPPELPSWLRERGFTQGYAWMKFSRACDVAPPQTACDLEIRVIGNALGDEFGQVAAEGFGLPPTAARWIGALAGRKDWVCVMAFADATPVATGAVYVNNGYAWLGFGATLASHRRRGAQTALLRQRLTEAAKRGARLAVTETGEQLPDKPSHSYRNILRSGFEEMYLRANFMSPPTDRAPGVTRDDSGRP